MQRPLSKRSAILGATAWLVCVSLALVSTLNSLKHDDFDGLNNIWQIPFALPWFLIPLATSNHELNAWTAAAMGWANAVLVYVWLTRPPRDRATRQG